MNTLFIDAQGKVECVYQDELQKVLEGLGGAQEWQRASHVEPVRVLGQWKWGVEVDGVLLGTFRTREAALAFEKQWVEQQLQGERDAPQ